MMKVKQNLTPEEFERAIEYLESRAELAEQERVRKIEEAEIEKQESFLGKDFWGKLERESLGKWAAISNGELLGICESREEATENVAEQHSGKKVLIRKIGTAPPTQFATPAPVRQRQTDIRETQVALMKLGQYYDKHLREKLEKEAFGQWAVVSNYKLFGVYKTGSQAAKAARPLLGKQVCLIRHIGYVLGLKGNGTQLDHVPVRLP